MEKYIPRWKLRIRRNICNICKERKPDNDSCCKFDCETEIAEIIKYFNCPLNKW